MIFSWEFDTIRRCRQFKVYTPGLASVRRGVKSDSLAKMCERSGSSSAAASKLRVRAPKKPSARKPPRFLQ